jgi:hypothetical protein
VIIKKKLDMQVPSREWVVLDPLTQSYRTRDGTTIPAELVDNITCLADVLRIAVMRDNQRAELRRNSNAN